MSDYQFKIGDKVIIVRRGIPLSSGFSNSWPPPMDAYINNGQIYTISYITNSGVRFKEGTGYSWDPKSLALAEGYVPPKPLSREEKVMLKCKKLWNTSKYVKQNPTKAY